MNTNGNRKFLISKIYKTIFREIFPVIVNNEMTCDTDYAAEINQIIEKRKNLKFNYYEYNYLELCVDDNVPEINYKVDAKKFQNWINGTSSPKYIFIINSILEYIITICSDKIKLDLLKDRVLDILSSNEFKAYAGDLIRDTVEIWIANIEKNGEEALFKATKEILYLLKDKNKFIPYILRESKVRDERSIEFAMEGAKEEVQVEPTVNKVVIDRANILKYISAAIFLVALSFICGSMVHRTTDNAAKTVLPLPIGVIDRSLAPDITSPANEDKLPLENIKLKWKPAASANSYLVTVTDTSTWAQIFSKNNIKYKSIVLDKTLFKTGGFYRIYVHSKIGNDLSLPNYIDIGFDKLLPPEITSPANEDILPKSDIKVQWKAVKSVDCYFVSISDTNNWTKIFSKSDIKDNFIVVDKSIFGSGKFYRIYVHSVIGQQISDPKYIDIRMDKK